MTTKINFIEEQSRWATYIWEGAKQMTRNSIRALPTITPIALGIISLVALPCVTGAETNESEAFAVTPAPNSTAVGFVQDVAACAFHGFLFFGMLGAAAHVNRPQEITCSRYDSFDPTMEFDAEMSMQKNASSSVEIRQELYTLAEQMVEISSSEEISSLEELSREFIALLDLYDEVEDELARRTETFRELVSFFREIQKQKNSPTEEFTQFHQVKQRIEDDPSLNLFVISDVSVNTTATVLLSRTEAKIIQSAFRTVSAQTEEERETLNKLFQTSLFTQGLNSRITLLEDLQFFLAFYDKALKGFSQTSVKKMISSFEMESKVSNEIILTRLASQYKISKLFENRCLEKKLNLIKEIQNAIQALQIGETYLVEGVYNIDESHSHLILHQIKRTADQEFRFTIINTGDGSDFHQCLDVEKKCLPLSFDRLQKEAVMDTAFWMNLINIMTFDASNKKGMSAVYRTFLKHFSNTEDLSHLLHLQAFESFSQTLSNPTNAKDHKPRKFYDLQTWGSCSYSPMEAFLEQNLAEHLFPFFKYTIQLRARRNLMELLPKSNFDIQVVELVNKKSYEALKTQGYKLNAICTDLLLAKSLSVQTMAGPWELKDRLFFWDQRTLQENEQLRTLRDCPDTLLAQTFIFGSVFAQEKCLSKEDLETFQMHNREFVMLYDLISRKSPEAIQWFDQNDGSQMYLRETFSYLEMVGKNQEEIEGLCSLAEGEIADIKSLCPEDSMVG